MLTPNEMKCWPLIGSWWPVVGGQSWLSELPKNHRIKGKKDPQKVV